MRQSLEAESEGEDEDLAARRADLTRRLEVAQAERSRYIRLFGQGLIEEDELEVQLTDLKNRVENLKMLIAAVDADLARESETRQVAASTEAWLMTLRENLEGIEQDTEEAWRARREIVTLLVEKVTAGRDKDGRTKVSVTYRFGPTEVEDFADGVRNPQEFRQPRSWPAPSSGPGAPISIVLRPPGTGRGTGRRVRTPGRLRLDVPPDAHEPRHDPLLRRDIRGPGSGERKRRPHRDGAGRGGVPRFGPLVVRVERGDRSLSLEALGRRPAVGQQDFRGHHRGVRRARPLGARGVRTFVRTPVFAPRPGR